MKTKAIAAIMTTMLLVPLVISVLPVKAAGVLKIGVIGPFGWPQFTGMQKGAVLAQTWINGPGGGIVIDGTRYDVQLEYGDEHAADLRPDLALLEMERLVGDGPGQEDVDLVFGGFMTECTTPMREVAMDYKKIYTICGAAANELVDCGGGAGACGACVRCDYSRYKYLFRATPVTQTMLLYNIVGFLRGYVLPNRLAPIYGSPVKTAVLAEDLTWTVDMYNKLVYGGLLGPQANIVYSARTPYPTTDFSSYLDAMHAAEVRLVVHIYTMGDPIALVQQMAAHPLKAVPVGIDVVGQTTDFWIWTGGDYDPPYGTGYADAGCQYETFLAASGTRSPISTTSQPYSTVEVWDRYFDAYGHAPIYTMWGVYDSIISWHDTLEGQTAIKPPFDQADYDALVPIIEATDRNGVLGSFKYTQYHDPDISCASPLGRYLDNDGSGNVTFCDVRLTDVTVSTASWESGTYRDSDGSGNVTVCDTRVTDVTVSTASWESGTYRDSDGSGNVTICDTRLTNVTVSTASWENGTYLDNDNSGNVTICDTRLTNVTVGETTYLAHTHVEEGDLDMNKTLTADAPTTYLAHTHVEECNYDIGIDLTADAPTTYLAHTFVEKCDYDIGDPCWNARARARPLVVQWQTGRLEVVWPADRAYSKKWVLPRKMYPHDTDVDQDGDVDMADLSAVGYAFGSYPVAPDAVPHARWQFAADVAHDNSIDTDDFVPVAADYGTSHTLPIPY